MIRNVLDRVQGTFYNSRARMRGGPHWGRKHHVRHRRHLTPNYTLSGRFGGGRLGMNLRRGHYPLRDKIRRILRF